MAKDSHAGMKFNSGSPSSDKKVVAKIVKQFMKSSDSVALDIGGTKLGFIAHLPSSGIRQRVVLVNKEGGDEITWRSVGLVPEGEKYDLVMMFGTAMYMGHVELRETFEKARRVLKPGGSFLLADIDGAHPASWIDLAIKIVVRIGWRSLPYRVYPKFYAVRALKSAGFLTVRNRSDLRARSGWPSLFRWVLHIIQPTRYYVVEAVKAPSAPSTGGVASSPPTAAPAPASVTGRR
ncbi:class I SAM-dependent methyltransferase [Rhizobium leguminosarum]|uniref:class I SAM-dependent methyltransferase n=1 Tax=Rhizobium leguminosarum TaxID=384 RepID=UPI0014424160|nr:class I SAM-dependent methyltransferase [Rhizobium leguminosarum]NKL63304.1 hypothetical protein [Rhizobium leguminosarum bv. viciae]